MENKLKTSLLCYSRCCMIDDYPTDDDDVHKILHFSDHKHRHHHHHHVNNLPTWFKSELPELKDRCANIFSGKFGRNNRHRDGNHQQVEFRYDPLSYALNFEDADSRLHDQFRPHRNFSSRLPPSPEASSEKRVVSTQVSAWR
ncbi:hypothetical protein vseg_005658 [Gypsophila vaccaria]